MLADLKLSRRDGILVAQITGEVDMSNASDLREALIRETSADEPGLVLDLSEMAYLDSAGIEMLYRLNDSLRVRGQSVRLVIRPGSPAADTLRLAGVIATLASAAAVDEAVAALRV